MIIDKFKISMNIGFDAKRLFRNQTGLGNYSRTLVRNIQELYPKHNYHLYTDRIVENDDTRYFLNTNKFIIHEGPKYFKSLWRAKFLVKDLEGDQIDVYHGLSNELPYGIHKSSVKSVVTIHDLIFKAYPDQYKLIDRKIYHLKSKYASHRSDRIVAISNATKNEIVNYYSPNLSKIDIIYQSCSQGYFNSIGGQNPTIMDNGIPKDYFLYVGSIIERKGLLNIAKAIASMPSIERPQVVVVGNGSSYLIKVTNYIEKHKLAQYFTFLKGISNAALGSIYNEAKALIYPSIMEGFGIPVIEAGLMSTPVISSNRSSLPEAGGPDIILIDPEKPSDIVDAIRSIINGDYPPERCEKVLNYINENFNKNSLSEQLMRLYENLIDEE